LSNIVLPLRWMPVLETLSGDTGGSGYPTVTVILTWIRTPDVVVLVGLVNCPRRDSSIV